jgi:hypothetical protein
VDIGGQTIGSSGRHMRLTSATSAMSMMCGKRVRYPRDT